MQVTVSFSRSFTKLIRSYYRHWYPVRLISLILYYYSNAPVHISQYQVEPFQLGVLIVYSNFSLVSRFQIPPSPSSFKVFHLVTFSTQLQQVGSALGSLLDTSAFALLGHHFTGRCTAQISPKKETLWGFGDYLMKYMLRCL